MEYLSNGQNCLLYLLVPVSSNNSSNNVFFLNMYVSACCQVIYIEFLVIGDQPTLFAINLLLAILL